MAFTSLPAVGLVEQPAERTDVRVLVEHSAVGVDERDALHTVGEVVGDLDRLAVLHGELDLAVDDHDLVVVADVLHGHAVHGAPQILVVTTINVSTRAA
jgi:hypothetical protein